MEVKWHLGGKNHPCMQDQELAGGWHSTPRPDTLS